jgi:alpha-1,6-mannosyltransferase
MTRRGDRTSSGSAFPGRGQARTVTGSTSRRARWALTGLVAGYGVLVVSAGSADAPLRPPLPSGVAVPSWTVHGARWMGIEHQSRAALTVLDLGLLVAVLVAFAAVLREAWGGRVRTGAASLAVGVSLALSVAAPLLLSRDAYSYAEYGRIYAVHGANPYVSPPASFPSDAFVRVASAEWLHARSRYGPAFELPSAAIARIWSHSSEATIMAFKVLAGGGIALACLFVARACRRLSPGRESVAVAALGLNPVVVVHTVGGGHNDAIVAALLAAAMALVARMATRDGPSDEATRFSGGLAVGTTALITMAALVKVIAALALGVWLWSLLRTTSTSKRARAASTHVGVLVAISLALFAPFIAGWRTVTPLVSPGTLKGWASGPHLVARAAQALVRAVSGASGTSPLVSRTGTAVTVAFLAAFAVLYWRLLREGTSRAAPVLWGASLLSFALAGPYLLPWYAAWFLPFVALFTDEALVWIGLGVAAVLALTGVPAEPGTDPGLYRGMLLGVHYVAAPIMLVALVAVAWRLITGRQGGRSRPPGRQRPWRTPAPPTDPGSPGRSA